MKKWGKVITCLVVIILIIAVLAIIIINGNKEESLLKVNSSADLTALVDKIYEKEEKPFPSIETTEIDVSDGAMVSSATGLENGDDFEYLVVSEPMISSQAYSLVLAKVKPGVDSDSVAKNIFDKINPRKWICVSAEKVSITTSDDVICLIMTNKEKTDKLMDAFKEIAGTVGNVYSKDVDDIPISDDMPGFNMDDLGIPSNNSDTDTEISNETTKLENEVSNNLENGVDGTEASNEVEE